MSETATFILSLVELDIEGRGRGMEEYLLSKGTRKVPMQKYGVGRHLCPERQMTDGHIAERLTEGR